MSNEPNTLLAELEMLVASFGTDLESIFDVQRRMEACGPPPVPTLCTELMAAVKAAKEKEK